MNDLAVEDEELFPHTITTCLQDKLGARGAAGITHDVIKAERETGGGRAEKEEQRGEEGR